MLRTSRSIKCIKAHAQKLKGAREDDEQVAGSTASIEGEFPVLCPSSATHYIDVATAPLGDDDGETTEKQTLDTTIAQTFEESFQGELPTIFSLVARHRSRLLISLRSVLPANSLAVNIESSSPQASSASASSPQLSEANVISSSSSTCLDVFSGLLPRWMWPTREQFESIAIHSPNES